jgi:hypothetical protein
MTRAELEHLIRVAADITQDDDIVVIGSQALLAQFPDAPPALRVSVEADMYPRNHPNRADLIDGSVGEGSPFHAMYGYYAQAVGEETAVLPRGWRDRLVPIRNANTRGATGWCLDVHDLAIAKTVAGREKDLDFLRHVLRHRLVDQATLRARLADTNLDDARRVLVEGRIVRAARAAGA